MASSLRPELAIYKGKRSILDILLYDVEQFGFFGRGCEQYLSRFEYPDLRDRFDVRLAITYLTQNGLCSS